MNVLVLANYPVTQKLAPLLQAAGHCVTIGGFTKHPLWVTEGDIALWLVAMVKRRELDMVVGEQAIMKDAAIRHAIANVCPPIWMLTCQFHTDAVKSSGWEWYVKELERIYARKPPHP